MRQEVHVGKISTTPLGVVLGLFCLLSVGALVYSMTQTDAAAIVYWAFAVALAVVLFLTERYKLYARPPA